MRSLVVLVNGGTLRVLSAGVEHIKHTLFPRQLLGRSRSSALLVLIPDETYLKIGMLVLILISESFYSDLYDTCNSIFLLGGCTCSSLPSTPTSGSS